LLNDALCEDEYSDQQEIFKGLLNSLIDEVERYEGRDETCFNGTNLLTPSFALLVALVLGLKAMFFF